MGSAATPPPMGSAEGDPPMGSPAAVAIGATAFAGSGEGGRLEGRLEVGLASPMEAKLSLSGDF